MKNRGKQLYEVRAGVKNITLNNRILKCNNFFIDVDEDRQDIARIRLVRVHKNDKLEYNKYGYGATSEELEEKIFQMFMSPIEKSIEESEESEELKDEDLIDIFDRIIKGSSEVRYLEEKPEKFIERDIKENFLYSLEKYVFESLTFTNIEKLEKFTDYSIGVKGNKFIVKMDLNIHLDLDNLTFVVDGYNLDNKETAKTYVEIEIS